MVEGLKAYQHLMNRAGFGAHPLELARWKTERISDSVDRIFHQSTKFKSLRHFDDPRPRRRDVAKLKVLLMAIKSKKNLKELNLAWLDRMGSTKAVLREKMTIFWHDHFATHVAYPILMQEQNNFLRKHALGSFRDLVHGIAKDPAMILYLNNQQNKKSAPNENFARELMELFTLGEGHYTEEDIKEAARAFTGWRTNGRGYYEFNEKLHDFGTKTFLGETGDFNGDDIINIILKQPQASRFICSKIYAYFVNPIIDWEIVDALSASFYQSDYNIELLMRQVFTSSWFYEDRNIGARIKSPVELLVQHKRWLNSSHSDQKVTLETQKILGQTLFFPPNVAGWPGNRAWIDSSTLIVRMKVPIVFFDPLHEGDNVSWSYRASDKLRANSDWKYIHQIIDTQEPSIEEVVARMSDLALCCEPSNEELERVKVFARTQNKEALIRSVFIKIMALPEFQLC